MADDVKFPQLTRRFTLNEDPRPTRLDNRNHFGVHGNTKCDRAIIEINKCDDERRMGILRTRRRRNALFPLTQINRENVANLKVAWVFHTGDISDGTDGKKRSGMETTPILVDGILYLTTGFNRVFAVNPETGKQLWAYDPMIELAGNYGDGLINRGVAAWLDPSRTKGKPCRRRIFEATLDARLIALDGATGEPCLDFGNRGTNQPSRCSPLRSRAISHDVSACGD